MNRIPNFTTKQLVKILQDTIVHLVESGQHPAASSFLMGTIIAQTIGGLPDDIWEVMKADAKVPCCTPECTCEVLRQYVMESLDALRTDFRIQSDTYPNE